MASSTEDAPVAVTASSAGQDATSATVTEKVIEEPGSRPKVTDKPSTSHVWPELGVDHPLTKLAARLESILSKADYNEVYGLKLVNPPDFHTNLILQKFLRANANDLDKAESQLLAALQWRKVFNPLKTLDEKFNRQRFGGLGYIIQLNDVPESPNKQDIATFNLYGAVKDPKLTFEDVEGFMRWRVALMEMSLAKLDLQAATEPIPDFGKGPDPYQSIQIHDYMQVSFLRQNPYTKAASNKAIETFKNYYPETLSRKYFVNVPIIMGWMFTAVSMLLSKETVKKFNVLIYGSGLAAVLGHDVPEVYGGKGKPLEEAGNGPTLED